MTEVHHEEPDANETPALLDTLNKFEQDTAITRGALSGYLDIPSDEQQELIANTFNDVSASFLKLTECILSADDMEDPEKVTMIASILFNDDTKRVTFLNELCNEDSETKYFTTLRNDRASMQDYIQTIFKNTADDPSDRIDSIHSIYTNCISGDLHKFLLNSHVTTVESNYEMRRERAEERKYLAKTALASAFGAAIVTWLFRKQKS